MTCARRCRARSGSDAAGCTRPDVPTTTRTSQPSIAAHARAHASSGSASPNQTTPGRNGPPHRGQAGGVSRAPCRPRRA